MADLGWESIFQKACYRHSLEAPSDLQHVGDRKPLAGQVMMCLRSRGPEAASIWEQVS